jgi:heat shock protein HtpX
MLQHEARRRNRWRILVIAAVALLNHWLLLTLVGAWFLLGVFDGEGWTALAIGGGAAAFVLALYLSIRLAMMPWLTMRDLGVVPVEPGEWPRMTNLLEEIAIATGTQPVQLAALHDPAPNALTVGVSHRSTVLVVTTGLVEQLRRDELEAVLAVQLAQIERRDVALQTVAAVCGQGAGGVFRFVRPDRDDAWAWLDLRGWFFAILAWPSLVAGRFVQWLAARAVDFGADDVAVSVTRHPDALRRALHKLRRDARDVRDVPADTAALWFEPIPLDGEEDDLGPFAGFAATPSLDERIARLPLVEAARGAR